MHVKIKKIFDYDIKASRHHELCTLLADCFSPDYPKNRSFFKQIPHFRFIALDEVNNIIGQVGLDYRIMNLNGTTPVKVLGIIDLCVKQEYRSNHIGSALLKEIEQFAIERNIDFLLLFADNKRLYEKHGFWSPRNTCKWLKVDDEQLTSFAIGTEQIDELMIKKVGNMDWQGGELDLMGYLY